MTASERVERTILGYCMQDDAEAVRTAIAELGPEHFYLDGHKRIFRCIASMAQAEKSVNIVTVITELSMARELEQAGGGAQISDMTTGLLNAVGRKIKEHTDRLKEFWRLRELQAIGEAIGTEIEHGRPESLDLVRRLSARLEALSADALEIPSTQVFLDFPEFVTKQSANIDWLLAGIIERGANGFIAADPKGGKSFSSIDLALAMATGSSWIGFAVPRPVKVGLVSREDNPALTSWRLKALTAGRQMTLVQLNHLEANLWVNTRAQTPSLMLDNERELGYLIGAVKERQLEFVFLDVLNILHGSDENDNTQMAGVLRKVRRIQDKTGSQIGIIHHYNKGTQGRLTQRLRGASAIAGFAEWMIGISMHDEEAKIRRMEFEIKAGAAPDPVYYCIDSDDHSAKISRVSIQAQPTHNERRKGVQ